MPSLNTTWLKPGVWGVVIGSIVTMIVGFSWGGWTTSTTARQQAMIQSDIAVTAALVPICLAGKKADMSSAKKLAQLTAFPGQADPNRAVAEACATALLKTAEAK